MRLFIKKQTKLAKNKNKHLANLIYFALFSMPLPVIFKIFCSIISICEALIDES